MARPEKVNLITEAEGWDSALTDNLDIIFDAPFPVMLGGHGLLSGDLLAFCDLL